MKLTLVKYYYPVVDLTEISQVVFLIPFIAKRGMFSSDSRFSQQSCVAFVAMYFFSSLIWNNPPIFFWKVETYMILIFLKSTDYSFCREALNVGVFLASSWLGSGYALSAGGWQKWRVLPHGPCQLEHGVGGPHYWFQWWAVEWRVPVRLLHHKVTVSLCH